MFRGKLEELVYWMAYRFYEKIAIGRNCEEKSKNYFLQFFYPGM